MSNPLSHPPIIDIIRDDDEDCRRVETTDGRYYKICGGREVCWWDTTGIDLVAPEVVEAYLAANPRVGIAVNMPSPDPLN